MSKPKPNSFYTVVDSDNLNKISNRAYGYNNVPEIIDANSKLLQPRIDKKRVHADLGGIPIVFKNDILWIPPITEKQIEKIEEIDTDFPNQIAIRINGKIFDGFTVTAIERSINTIVDFFSFSAPFEIDDPNSKYLDPFTYYKTDLFIGGKLFLSGVSEKWDPVAGESSTMTSIQVRSKAGVLVDCSCSDSTLSYTKQTFKQIAEKVMKPFGIILETPYGDSGIINKAKRTASEKVFSFIASLAKQKGFILNSSVVGGIKLDRANINGNPIMNLKQGEFPLLSVTASYDGTQRFSVFQAIGQTRGNPSNQAIAVDKTIPVHRPIIFDASNNDQGEIKDAAKWERARSLASSATITATVSGWRDKNGEIILENNTVTLLYPKVHIYKETKFLIEKVSLIQDGGDKAVLSLVLPQAYTLDFPEVMPWQR